MFSRVSLALIGFALFAAPAHARMHPNRAFVLPLGPVSAPIVRPALRLAQRVWRPGCGALSLSVEQAPAELGGGDFVGTLAGWASPGDCTIHLPVGMRYMGAPELCETVLHEAGHVADFHEAGGPDDGAHSGDPNNIMYPIQIVGRFRARVAGVRGSIITWIGVDWRCRHAYHVYGAN